MEWGKKYELETGNRGERRSKTVVRKEESLDNRRKKREPARGNSKVRSKG